ncbi:MAG TPA: zinc ABC transporter substrate-binding protein, partial [Alphaproteobacteria bacterium]|nr:zinc ABC transporter substrate-binding protein [Alphaproteobacteria bacterium]
MTRIRCSLLAAAARALGAAMVLALAIPASATAKPKAPNVVVSILPIHSLVAGVMAGVGTPKLLIDRLASPHDYAMRPSDAEALNKADLVIWVGPTLESFLIKPLSTLSKKTKIITLTREPSLHVIHIAGGKGATRA